MERLALHNRSGFDVVLEFGRHIQVISGDAQESDFPCQRLSVCTQQSDALAFTVVFDSRIDMAC